jgi:hypothetical protein
VRNSASSTPGTFLTREHALVAACPLKAEARPQILLEGDL